MNPVDAISLLQAEITKQHRLLDIAIADGVSPDELRKAISQLARELVDGLDYVRQQL